MKSLMLLLAVPLAVGGCGLFGGGGDDEEQTPEQGAYMEGSSEGAASSGEPAAPAAPSKALPLGALLVSGITLVALIVHIVRRRPHAAASGP